MDDRSLTRTNPPSTRQIVADEGICSQVAALLACEEEAMRHAFLGEPAEEVLAMAGWALSHRDDAGFDAEAVLLGWAEKRGRGRWSIRPAAEPTASGQHAPGGNGGASATLAEALIGYWSEHPGELAALLERVSTSLNGRAA